MSIFDSNPVTEPAGNSGVSDAGTSQPVVADTTVTPVTPDPVQPVVSDAGQPAADVQPTVQYLDPDQYGDHLVKIKVDGEEKEVPFSKVRDGLMMQEAFTKRTQELAQERRTLHQANSLMAMLEADPKGTIQRLSEAYDLDPAAGFAPVQREPEEQALIQQKRALAAQQAQFQQQRIDYEINRLINDFGVSEADIPSLADAAVRMGTDLETAYKVLTFEKMQNGKTQQPPAQQQRVQAALEAQAVHSGASTQRGVATEAPKKVNSIHDAFEASKRELRAMGINV